MESKNRRRGAYRAAKRLLAAAPALLLAACASVGPASPSSLPGANQPLVPQQSQAPQSPAPGAQALPQQVREYLRLALDASVLVTVNPRGETVKTVYFPDSAYSDGTLTPDGRYMLCRKDAEGAGEAFWSGYVSIDLETSEEYDSLQTQWGHQAHRILGDNLIGFASGSAVGGLEDPWEPIKLFDIHYNRLDVALDFDFGREIVMGSGEQAYSYLEHSVTGIARDPADRRFVLTYAKDISHLAAQKGGYFDPFSQNRLGVAVFDRDGRLIKDLLLPEEYAAPYSHNVLVLVPGDPAVVSDGRLLLAAATRQGASSLLLLDLDTWRIESLPYSQHGRVDRSGGSVLAIREEPSPPYSHRDIIALQNGAILSTRELPSEIAQEGYPSPFYPSDAVWDDDAAYILAHHFLRGEDSFAGLFFSDGATLRLIHLLPLSYCNLVGLDGEGNCMFLISGATEQSREYYERALGILPVR